MNGAVNILINLDGLVISYGLFWNDFDESDDNEWAHFT